MTAPPVRANAGRRPSSPPLIVNVRPRVAFGYPLGNLEVARRQPNAIQVVRLVGRPRHHRAHRRSTSTWTASAPAITTAQHPAHRRRPALPVARQPARLQRRGPGQRRHRTSCVRTGSASATAATVSSAARTCPATPSDPSIAATRRPGAVALRGWAIDPDTTDPVPIHVYVDGVGDRGRHRERDAHRRREPHAGLRGRARVRPHRAGHRVTTPCARTRSARGASRTSRSGARAPAATPRGALDSRPVRMSAARCACGAGRSIRTPRRRSRSHVYVDGVGRVVGTADTNRPDVGTLVQRRGATRTAIDLTVGGVTPGSHQVCTYGHQRPAAAPTRRSGCRHGPDQLAHDKFGVRPRQRPAGEGALHAPAGLAHDRPDVAVADEPCHREHFRGHRPSDAA